jgi:hypothetical protein
MTIKEQQESITRDMYQNDHINVIPLYVLVASLVLNSAAIVWFLNRLLATL